MTRGRKAPSRPLYEGPFVSRHGTHGPAPSWVSARPDAVRLPDHTPTPAREGWAGSSDGRASSLRAPRHA